MHVDWWTIGLQTFNFAILVWLLERFLYGPVVRMIDARRAEIDSRYDEARAVQSKAKAHLEAVEAERAGISDERAAALEGAARQAREVAETLRKQAESEARTMLEGARRTLATEREAALEEAQRVALDLGAEFARRLLADVPLRLRTEAWIEQVEHRLEALPKADLEILGRQFSDGGRLTVVTSVPLEAPMADLWRDRLRRRFGDVAIDFETDPDLVAGADLHFPTSVLRFSWQSALAAMRSEIEVHDHARR